MYNAMPLEGVEYLTAEEEDTHYEYHKNCFCEICIAKRRTL